MIASIPSATLLGIRGHPVLVEAQVSNGLLGSAVIGLPDADCCEARDRCPGRPALQWASVAIAACNL